MNHPRYKAFFLLISSGLSLSAMDKQPVSFAEFKNEFDAILARGAYTDVLPLKDYLEPLQLEVALARLEEEKEHKLPRLLTLLRDLEESEPRPLYYPVLREEIENRKQDLKNLLAELERKFTTLYPKIAPTDDITDKWIAESWNDLPSPPSPPEQGRKRKSGEREDGISIQPVIKAPFEKKSKKVRSRKVKKRLYEGEFFQKSEASLLAQTATEERLRKSGLKILPFIVKETQVGKFESGSEWKSNFITTIVNQGIDRLLHFTALTAVEVRINNKDLHSFLTVMMDIASERSQRRLLRGLQSKQLTLNDDIGNSVLFTPELDRLVTCLLKASSSSVLENIKKKENLPPSLLKAMDGSADKARKRVLRRFKTEWRIVKNFLKDSYCNLIFIGLYKNIMKVGGPEVVRNSRDLLLPIYLVNDATVIDYHLPLAVACLNSPESDQELSVITNEIEHILESRCTLGGWWPLEIDAHIKALTVISEEFGGYKDSIAILEKYYEKKFVSLHTETRGAKKSMVTTPAFRDLESPTTAPKAIYLNDLLENGIIREVPANNL